MSSIMTPNLGLSLIFSGQAEAHKSVNLDFSILDALVGGKVLSRTANSPPGTVNGSAYLVGSSPSGDWSAFSQGDLVVYMTNKWVEFTPKEGWVLWLADEKVVIRYNGSAWVTYVGEAVFASRSAAGLATVDGTDRFIPWDADDRVGNTPGTSSVYTHSTSSNSEQITLAENGDYYIAVQATFNATAGAANARCELSLTLNGSDITGTVSYVYVNSGSYTHVTATVCFTLVNSGSAAVLRVKAIRGAGSGTINIPANTARITIQRK